jgi:hypothetical protein
MQMQRDPFQRDLYDVIIHYHRDEGDIHAQDFMLNKV